MEFRNNDNHESYLITDKIVQKFKTIAQQKNIYSIFKLINTETKITLMPENCMSLNKIFRQVGYKIYVLSEHAYMLVIEYLKCCLKIHTELHTCCPPNAHG